MTNTAFKTTFKPYRKLVILGQTIAPARIKHIFPLNAELDYPDLTTFNIGNVSVTLFDPEGEYNPNNPNNFWTKHWQRTDIPAHYNQVGYKGSLEIHIGYDHGTVQTEKVFDGEVANIRVNLQPPEVIIEAVDASQNLRPAKLDNFGIPRKVILNEDTASNNVTTYSGRYPFPAYSIPSDRSVSAVTNIGRTQMTDVGTISTEGNTSPLNYQIANGAIETEGGPLWAPNKPLTTYKDVFRYKRVDTLVKNILEQHGITDHDIDIPTQTTDTPHFATHGRPGWDLENTTSGLAQHWNWDGYIKDIVYDVSNTKYYMLYGQQDNNRADYLISYDVKTDTWARIATTDTTISNITRQYEMWQLATDDFNTFFVLATVHLTEGKDDTLVRGTYDAQESATSHITILKYDLTNDTWSVADNASGNAPQIGFYYSAFEPPTSTTTRYPMLPDTRTTFTATKGELIYRGKNGFHAYRISNSTKRTLKTIPTSSLRSMDCWIGGTPQTTFFAWIEQQAGNSVLRIDNGNGNSIVNTSYDNSDNPLFNAPANPSTGDRTSQIITISDMIHHAGELYAVLQIKAGVPTDIYAESEGVLINIKVSSGNISRVKHYPQFTRAARSPVIHNGEVYYFEGSHYQYQPHAEKVNRAGTLQPHASEAYPDDTGNLIRMDGDEYVDFGLCWRSAFQNPTASSTEDNGYGRHGGTASPMVSNGEAIQFWAGYGDITHLNKAPANDINNYQWLQFGRHIPQRIPIFHTNGKQTWDLINTLAKLTNTTISYRKGTFSFGPRATRQTTLTADITDTTSSLIVQDASRFDDTGMVLINDELISYQFLGSNQLSNLVRGAEQSKATSHKKGDTVLFVDALVFNHTDKKNLGSLNFKPDFLGIYNQLTAQLTPINGTNAEVNIENAESIAANGEKPRDFNLNMLSWHERPWAETLLNAYLTEMQQAQFEVSLEVPWSPHLRLGQTLVVDQQVVAHLRWTPVRILRISHDFDARTTRITARTFGLHRDTPPLTFDTTPDKHYTFIVNQQITPLVLKGSRRPPSAVLKGSRHTPYAVLQSAVLSSGQPVTYELSALPPGLSFDAATRTITGTPTTTGTTTITYTAKDASTQATLHFRITIANALAFEGTALTDLIWTEGCYIDHALPTAAGGTAPITYQITGLPPKMSFNSSARRIHGIMPAGKWQPKYSAKDADNTITQTFNIIGDSKPKWRSFFVDTTESGILDGASGALRLFDAKGNRKKTQNGKFNINLGTGNWRGVTTTDTRIIFVNSAGNVRFYDMQYTPQPTEHFTLPAGNWQDVAPIDSNTLGFLDRKSGAVRMYSHAGTRMASSDIVFGFSAKFRSIASDGVHLYLLIENLDTILVWHITNGAFVESAAIDILAGSSEWQAVRLRDANTLALLRPATATLHTIRK